MATISEALNQGWRWQQEGRWEPAEQLYRHIIAQVPGNPEAHVYLGMVLFDQQRYAESEAAYREALRLREAFPIAWNNLGNSLRMLDRLEEADACFATALRQQPGYLNAVKNRGTLWVWAGELARGLQWYEQALQIAPENPEIHRNLGVIYLLQGRFAEGWEAYRWRWQMPGLVRPSVAAPVWQGEALPGRRILLYPEQGVGDAFHFVRMAGLLHQHGAETWLQCSERLVPLLASAPGIDRVLPPGPLPGPVDYQASLLEVADQLRIDQERIPEEVPYLSVPESLQQQWAAYFSGLPGRRIGLCWQGNPQYHADHYRSVPLAQFAPLAALPGVTLISLQQGPGTEQLEQVPFGEQIIRLPASRDQSGGAFLDTAAIMQALDAVVTVDTSAGHLAGALGVPTWLVLGKVPDWRWLMEGETSPWYPHHRLVRQREVGRWEPVFAELAEQLRRDASLA
jgi:tetratricopeptide (TPR) repeat protein